MRSQFIVTGGLLLHALLLSPGRVHAQNAETNCTAWGSTVRCTTKENPWSALSRSIRESAALSAQQKAMSAQERALAAAAIRDWRERTKALQQEAYDAFAEMIDAVAGESDTPKTSGAVNQHLRLDFAAIDRLEEVVKFGDQMAVSQLTYEAPPGGIPVLTYSDRREEDDLVIQIEAKLYLSAPAYYFQTREVIPRSPNAEYQLQASVISGSTYGVMNQGRHSTGTVPEGVIPGHLAWLVPALLQDSMPELLEFDHFDELSGSVATTRMRFVKREKAYVPRADPVYGCANEGAKAKRKREDVLVYVVARGAGPREETRLVAAHPRVPLYSGHKCIGVGF